MCSETRLIFQVMLVDAPSGHRFVLNNSANVVFCSLTCGRLVAPSSFAEKKNVTLTSGHDILEFFVVFGIDSITIIIQNDDTAPQFYGIF